MDNSSETEELARRVGRQIGFERELRRMTATELAERSGLSRTILATIERGDGNPSIGTLWRIARALRVPLGTLLTETSTPTVRVMRVGAGERLQDPSGLVGRLLHADAGARRTEVFTLELPPGARRDSPAHQRGVEELVVVTAGRAEVGPVAQPETLTTGDAVWFRADEAHVYAATADEGCTFLDWVSYPAG